MKKILLILLNKIKKYRIIQNDISFTPYIQVGPKTQQTIKDVNKEFDKQWDWMQANAMRSHEVDCDIINCIKEECNVFVPDKIVSKPYEVHDKKYCKTDCGCKYWR